MKQRPTALRIIVLLVALGLVGGYVVYRVWADGQPANAADPPIQFGGSKSRPVLPANDLNPPQTEPHFAGSKSARVFEPPAQPVPPEPAKSLSEDLGPVGPKP